MATSEAKAAPAAAKKQKKATSEAKAAPAAATSTEPVATSLPTGVIKEFVTNGIPMKRIRAEDGTVTDVRA